MFQFRSDEFSRLNQCLDLLEVTRIDYTAIIEAFLQLGQFLGLPGLVEVGSRFASIPPIFLCERFL